MDTVMNYSVEKEFEVKSYDIDAAGHVNNIVYIRWLEYLRTELFEKFLPIGILLKEKQYPVVLETLFRYKKQMKYGDICNAKMFIERFDRSIWVLKAEFNVNDKTSSTAVQKCAVIDLLTNKIQKPPKCVLEKFKE